MDDMIGAGIVTYNPDIERLKINIHAIVDQVYEILIVDNASANLTDIISIANEFDKIHFIKNDANYGIAKALNIICHYFKKKKYKWVLTLDQDSICPKNMITTYRKYINGSLGILCPQIYDLNLKNKPQKKENVFVHRCITSGSLTNIDAWEKIHGFDEKIFIDGVDFDFCDRLNKYGYGILRINSIVLKHEIGYMQEKRFLLFKVKVKNHSAYRKYYMAKNIVYLDRKSKCNTYPFTTVLREIKLILVVLIYEKDKFNKIKQILKGMQEGFQEKLYAIR